MPDQHELKATNTETQSRTRTIRFLSAFSIASSCVVFSCMGCCFLAPLLLHIKVTETPKGADDAVVRITQCTIPAGFEGKTGLIADNRFFYADLARFDHQQGRGLLCMAQLHAALMPDQQAKTRQFLETATPELKGLKVDQTRSLKLTIRDLPADFRIDRGEDRASTTRLLQVTGFFRGLRDDAGLILQCEEGVLTDEQIDQFIKSIK